MIEPTEVLNWQRARRCASGNCVEVARARGQVLVRNSTDPDVILSFTEEEWEAFEGGVKEGEFSS